MLYLFYGSDRNKALTSALNIIEKKIQDKPDAVVFKIDQTNFSKEVLVEMCGGRGLFEQKYIVHIKDVCDDEVGQETLFAFLKELKESENIFILTEGDLNKKEIIKLEKFADKVWNHEAKKKIEKEENIFAITNYLLARDKKNLWIEYQKLKNVFAAEEIHGTLFWAFKNIMIASKTKSASEAGLKPFVYSNSKRAVAKFSQEELDEKFWHLTKLLGDSRRGEGELEILLEKWVLGV
jgi:DNA polymerase III delta subunit